MDGIRKHFYWGTCGLVLAAGLFAVCNVGAQGVPVGTALSVTLAWQAPSPVGGSGTVGGYNVYRSPANTGASTANYAKVNAAPAPGLTYTDTSVAAGSSYNYCVTTVDSLGEESACSASATANVPTNPNAPSAPLITTK